MKITIRLSEDLHTELKLLATKENRSINNLITQLITNKVIEQYEREHNTIL